MLGALAFGLVAAGFVSYGVRAGMSGEDAVLAVLVVAVTQVLPGALAWRCVRPRAGWWFEDLAMGFAIGAVLAVVAQVLAGLTRLGWLSAGVGIAVAAILIVVPGTRARIVSARTSPMPWWWGPLVALPAITTLPLLHALFRETPLTWTSRARVPYTDSSFHLGLASQLANRGPTDFPFVKSEPLGYHWFSHAWVAQVSRVSGAALEETLFRFLPVIIPMAVVLAVGTAAVRLSARAWAGPVAAGLTMATVGLNVFGRYTSDYFFNPLFHPRSPSLAFAAPILVGLVVVLALRWRRQLGRGSVVLLIVLSIGAVGSKGSTLPLIVAGLMLAVVAMWFVDRSRVRELLVDVVIVVGCLLFAYATIFRGFGSERLRLDPSRAAARTAEAHWLGGVSSAADETFVVVLAIASVLSQGVAMLGLLTSRRSRRDPLTWLLIGAGLGAAATVCLVSGAGQEFFARSAAPLLALGSTLGLVVLIGKLGASARTAVLLGIIGGPVIALAPVALLGPLDANGTGHAVAMLAVAAAAVAVVATVAAIAGADRRRLVVGSTLAIAILTAGTTVVINSIVHHDSPRQVAVAVGVEGAVSRDQVDAARWIRDHSDVDDLVMTNRHCLRPAVKRRCDNRRFVVAAWSERQVLVEGWGYLPKAIELGSEEGEYPRYVEYWSPDLLALNDGFIEAPTADAARRLEELGVRWVFVDHTVPHAETLEPFAHLRFSNPGVAVYELPTQAS